MGLPTGIFWLLAILILFNKDVQSQTKRSRSSSASRALGLSPKTSNGIDFECPEEFGYYPHPHDCSQYYVCVFGGALLESCTGGLMYSHELQTCDWPRNVGCELAEISAPSAPAREVTPRIPQLISRTRFSSLPTGPSGGSAPSGSGHSLSSNSYLSPSGPSAPAHIQQIQTLPPPPEPLRVAPNPVITTRGQPKNNPQEDIIKLYSEAHDTLPPVEEEESDRQQRVYRGQPSTVGQVQRDRDGILQQQSVNAIPTQAKVGSFAYSSPQLTNYSIENLQDLDADHERNLDRKKRDVTQSEGDSDNNARNSPIATESDSAGKLESFETTDDENKGQYKRATNRFVSADFSNDDSDDGGYDVDDDTDEVQRKTRQLRASFLSNSPWQFSNENHFRSLDYQSRQNDFQPFDPFSNANSDPTQYYKSGGRFYQDTSSYKSGSNRNYNNPAVSTYKKNQYSSDFKPSYQTNVYNRPSGSGSTSESFPPNNNKQTTKVSSIYPVVYPNGGNTQQYPSPYTASPYSKKPRTTTDPSSGETIPDNFAYFHIGNKNKQYLNTTPRSPFVAFSSVGGFFNNQPTAAPINENFHPSQQPYHVYKQQQRQSTPAPVYERDQSGITNSFNVRHQASTTLKPVTTNTYYTGGGAFINNAKFTQKPESVYSNYNVEAEITTKKANGYSTAKVPSISIQKLVPIDIPTPKYNKLDNPALSQNFNFNKFINNIRETHLSQIDPKSMEDSIKYIGANNVFKNFTNNFNGNLNKINYAPTSTKKPKINADDHYYDRRLPQIIKPLSENEKFGKPASVNILKTNNKIKSRPLETNAANGDIGEDDDDDATDNGDEDVEYYDDDETEEEYNKFVPNKSIYSPMSETMAPKVKNNTVKNSTPTYTRNNLYGYSTTTATTRKVVVEYKYETTTPPSVGITTSNIPPIIKFPDDVFQGIKSGVPRYSSNRTAPLGGTVRQSANIIRHRNNRPTHIDPNNAPTATTTNLAAVTEATATSTTTKKIYTIRPNRGNSKWRTAKPSTRTLTNKQNLELDEKLPNRVESSSQAPQNTYHSQKPISQNSNHNNNNKNYYNTSNYDPSSYDTYYSVYDEDVELYRDVDAYQPPQYNVNPQKASVSSTYRPPVITTHAPSPPPQQPQRETYVTQAPPQQHSSYRPSSVDYSADYDDALVAQLEDEKIYNPPSRTRGDRNELLNTVTERPVLVSSTLRTFSPKYSSPSAYVTTPVPFSLPSTTTAAAPVTSTQTTVSQYYPTRSTLSEGTSNKTSSKNIILTRAGSSSTQISVQSPPSPPLPSLPPPIRQLPIPIPFPIQTNPLASSSSSVTTTLNPIPTTNTTTQLKHSVYPKFQSQSPFFHTNNKNNNNDTTTENYKMTKNATVTFTDSRTNTFARKPSSISTRIKLDLDHNKSTAEVEQRKRILNYIMSDLQPQSFKAPAITTSTTATTTTASTSTTPTTFTTKTTDTLSSTSSTPSSHSISFASAPSLTSFSINLSQSQSSSSTTSSIPSAFYSAQKSYHSDNYYKDYNSNDYDNRDNNNAFVNTPNPFVRSAISMTSTQTSIPKSLTQPPQFHSSINQANPSGIPHQYPTQSLPPPLPHPQSSYQFTPLNNNNNNNNDNIDNYSDDKYKSYENNKTNNIIRLSSVTTGPAGAHINAQYAADDAAALRSVHSDRLKLDAVAPKSSALDTTTYAPTASYAYVKKPTPFSVQHPQQKELIQRDRKNYSNNNQEIKYSNRPQPEFSHEDKAKETSSTNTANAIATRFPPRTTLASVKHNGTSDANYKTLTETFTSRGLIFKENLNKKNFEPAFPSRQIISPYKSLETQRQTGEYHSLERIESVSSANSSIDSLPPTGRGNHGLESPQSRDVSTPVPAPTTFRSIVLSTTLRAVTEAPILATTTTSITTMSTPTSTTYSSPISTTGSTYPTSTMSSTYTTTSPMDYPSESARSLEHKRGRYRPYQTFSTTRNYVESEEPTTYAPKVRFNLRPQSKLEISTQDYEEFPASTDAPLRRKIIRQRPLQSFSNYVTTIRTNPTTITTSTTTTTAATPTTTSATTSTTAAARSTAPAPTPIPESRNLRKYSEYRDTSARVELIKDTVTSSGSSESLSIVEITDKPIYYTRFRYVPTHRNNLAWGNETVVNDGHRDSDRENTTKLFRATVEMPEMKVPSADELFSNNTANEYESHADDVDEYEQDNEDDIVIDENEENDFSSAIGINENESNSLNGDSDIEEYDSIDNGDRDRISDTFEQTAILSRLGRLNVTETVEHRTLNPSTPPSSTTTPISTLLPSTTTTTTTSTTTTTTNKPTTTETTTTTTTKRTLLKSPIVSSLNNNSSINNPKSVLPPRVSRVNNAIKTTIAAGQPRRPSASKHNKCIDNSPHAKCNEIPSRTNTRNRGNTHQHSDQQSTVAAVNNRGTHPPRARPTLKPSNTIVSKAQEFVDIYRYPPTRPDPLYPQPQPDKTAAKCRKDVCLLPDCYCGGRDIPADMPVEQVPQIVLLTFDDSVNDLNKGLYTDLFERGRVNPNGCPISATFYVSHEWTDYSQVQNLYADGHEMASHTVSHSFGEQFSTKKWAREVAGQREILSAYGGVKLEDVRGMRSPFLSIGGNKMFKMLHDFNFTYDSSMPVYENRPPSWPYTLDYKIFHDCMIPPCPTKSYPGVWEVPMVMWQDLNGGRCSMGDACSNPSEADGVYKMIMKNFERHYTTNRAPFGLFYHAAWFTQPHHKEGFIQFLDAINAMKDVYIVTNWQALQWVRDPTPISRMNSFQPFQCNYVGRPKRCNNPKVCNLWHKSGVRYMRTCQPCPEIYPWTGKSGIRSSRIDNDIEIADTT